MLYREKGERGHYSPFRFQETEIYIKKNEQSIVAVKASVMLYDDGVKKWTHCGTCPERSTITKVTQNHLTAEDKDSQSPNITRDNFYPPISNILTNVAQIQSFAFNHTNNQTTFTNLEHINNAGILLDLHNSNNENLNIQYIPTSKGNLCLYHDG
ncbi:unnamed protein product [Gordionus sp. m RMFG-2023]